MSMHSELIVTLGSCVFCWGYTAQLVWQQEAEMQITVKVYRNSVALKHITFLFSVVYPPCIQCAFVSWIQRYGTFWCHLFVLLHFYFLSEAQLEKQQLSCLWSSQNLTISRSLLLFFFVLCFFLSLPLNIFLLCSKCFN